MRPSVGCAADERGHRLPRRGSPCPIWPSVARAARPGGPGAGNMSEIGNGEKVFDAAPVRGAWRRLDSPDDVLELMDGSAEGVVACVADAGATFLAPIFDELTAVVCLSGTP